MTLSGTEPPVPPGDERVWTLVSQAGAVAAVLGNTLEFYDLTVYSFFAVFVGRASFPTKDPTASLLLSVATFGVGFPTRPIGAAVLGA